MLVVGDRWPEWLQPTGAGHAHSTLETDSWCHTHIMRLTNTHTAYLYIHKMYASVPLATRGRVFRTWAWWTQADARVLQLIGQANAYTRASHFNFNYTLCKLHCTTLAGRPLSRKLEEKLCTFCNCVCARILITPSGKRWQSGVICIQSNGQMETDKQQQHWIYAECVRALEL